MKSILIAYEDAYFSKLHALVKRLRKDRGDAGHVIEPRPIKGTGNFIREVPSLLRMPHRRLRLAPIWRSCWDRCCW